MKTARDVYSEVQKKAGSFPFNIRILEDEKRSRMGLQEAVQHSLVKPYEVLYVFTCFVLLAKHSRRCRSYTPSNTFVAGFHFTIALLPSGPLLISQPPIWYNSEVVKTEKELQDEELKSLIARNLRENKKSKKKAKKAEGESEEKAE